MNIEHRIVLATVLLALVWWTAPVRAGGLIVSLDNVTGPTAGNGTFEVLLTNTNGAGGQSFDVASFSFELSLPVGSGIQFTDAITTTLSAPYLFEGTGGASVDPSFTLSTDTFPNTHFAGSDTEFTFLSINVPTEQTFGLGLIAYSVNANAPAGDVPISFVSGGTSLADASGAAISFASDAANGIIHVGTNGVPEPSTLVMGMSALGLICLAATYRRGSTSK